MPQNLVIVESPAKAKTIEGYLGKDYKVVSCYGHIRDLPKKGLAIDIKNGFIPTYEISDEKKVVVKELKKLVAVSDSIYLASDDDREGESISWHLKEALDLPESKIKRIVFREITKKAIISAIENPRTIDQDLVNSQQARRLLDRLVGYDLSPVLWMKIKRGLSAGRVQSVAVRMVVEREREINKFQTESNFVLSAIFSLSEGIHLESELPNKLKNITEAKDFLEKCKKALFTIKKLETRESKRSPSAPFTTSSLQQEASTKLGFSVSQTMIIAQKLYEAGKISYMRTDSVNLSSDAIQNAKSTIEQNFGKQYFKQRKYETKSANAQEAHEAIRPTDFSQQDVSSDKNEQRLYNIIWKRSIASQMEDAKIDKTIAHIDISTTKELLRAEGEVVVFDGFLKAYTFHSDENAFQDMLPPLTVGQNLVLQTMQARERFTKAPPRFAEAGLVKQLEERGIGRPSTYAPIISTIQKRGYVVKEDREGKLRNYNLLTLEKDKIKELIKTETVGSERQKLFPTDIAMVVNDFLVEHFPDITNYDFTAKIEGDLDIVANGKMAWNYMLDQFYKDFYPKLEKTQGIIRSTISSDRILGTDPTTGKAILARLGKYGPLVQLGENDTENPPKYAALRGNQRLETISLQDALNLFKLPREVGEFENEVISVNVGRFGPYIKHKGLFYSISKEKDLFCISSEETIQIIADKRKSDSEKLIKRFEEDNTVQILNGRWGPYIKQDKKNVRVPKNITDPTKLSLEECLIFLDNAPEKGKR
jgi:DNA topoisomerase-1